MEGSIRKKRVSRYCALVGAAVMVLQVGLVAVMPVMGALPLTTLEYRVTGTALQVSPPAVAVPKGIAGSVRVDLTGGEGAQSLGKGAFVEAFLRGPGLPEPRRLVGPVNEALLFPPLNLVGDYQLDSIRLVDAVTGETRLEGTPKRVPVNVFDEVLVSRVTSRPLTYEEIQEKGIYIDESNFRVVEFEAAFVIDGQTVPIQFPVVSPNFAESTELIPAAELQERLAEAAVLNQELGETTELPPEFETANLNIQIQGINFQTVDPTEPEALGLRIPPIPAMMVIPGNIGFLNQFFSVQIFTENAAPQGSGLSVYNIEAALTLPPGPDQLPAADYANPGDDPLRFARIGPERIIQPVQQIVQPGTDGEVGTPDDNPELRPGESGQAEFLVEGLQEGLHVMDLDLVADMDGLAAGPVKVMGKAAGSVLVRNPKFSMAFSHPRTVRVGEPYDASVTLLNTGITPANLVQVTLNRNSISGAELVDENQQTIELGTLLPGETATATFRMRSLRTGSISFSNLTTSDDSVVGRFRLRMGVDERGVALSPDSIGMPDFVNQLPPDLLFAANRVLGQALSVATAGQLPPGVTRVGKSIVTRRVLDLAEAGQRIQYGDPLERVLTDLLRDWEGGRRQSTGFDQILRETEAGREWRMALFAAMEDADGLSGTDRIADRAPDLAGLGQAFALAGANDGELSIEFADAETVAAFEESSQPYALVYEGADGRWASTVMQPDGSFVWTFPGAPPSADLSVLLVTPDGMARQLAWTIDNPPADATYRFLLGDASETLEVDLLSDGEIDSFEPAVAATIDELPPDLVAVEQDLYVNAGRPSRPCVGPDFLNYGQVVAVVFSKSMTQESAGDPGLYTVDGDNGANSVTVQPGGRVAYLNLRKGISAIIPRSLTIDGVSDVRGNPLPPVTTPIRSVEPGTEDTPFTDGVAIKGRALKGDGSPAPGIPVTLTMYDGAFSRLRCGTFVRRVSQVITDEGGNFSLDYIMSGIPYSISATDTSGLSSEALELIAANSIEGEVEREQILQLATSASTRDTLLGLFAAGSIPEAIAKVEGLDRALVRDTVQLGSSREGQMVPIALRFRGRATVVGQVVAEDGATPVAGAAVNLFPDQDSREKGRGIFADSEGRFAFYGVPLGVFSVEVTTSDRRSRTVAGLLDQPNQVEALTIALPSNLMPRGSLQGTVFEADNLTPHGGARIIIGDEGGGRVQNVVRIVDADAEGNWQADDLPAKTFDVVAVSFDGQRKGVRKDYPVMADALSVVNLSLEATTELFGRVQFDDGRPAANALVAGGLTLVRTDANGNFQLEGVPVGRRTISAGLERDPANGVDFPRLGSARVNVVAGAANYVVVKLRSAGRIFGRVTDLTGAGIGGIRVAIPVTGGFYWTDADAQGNYLFENLALGSYTVSAPANAVAPTFDVNELNAQIRSGDEDKILAAFEEAIRVFVGADDPLITGEQRNFRPITWGFTTTRLQFDGQSVEANIQMQREGTVAGRVLNDQGVPIGARVRLTGRGPDLTGKPTTTIRGERDSDPATGVFIFPGQLLVGPWTVQAASPFYPTVIRESGFTTDIDPDVTGVELQFPPIRDFNGRLVGQVIYPDGSLVGEGVRVKVNLSADYEIQTDTNGFFDTQIAIPGGRYRVEAIDDVSGLRGLATVRVSPGITNEVEVSLLSRDSTIDVTVLRGNGLPASGAQVDLEQGTYPYDPRITVFADANGQVRFQNLWEGRYAVCAQYTEASTRVFARTGATVGAEETQSVTLRLGATGTIRGRFVKLDQTTPVGGAQVSVGNLGFAATDADGQFEFVGVPLGSYSLLTSDPVSGAYARGSASVSFADQVVEVLLVEGARGEINGYVIDSFGEDVAAGATVTVRFTDGLTARRTVTTGPDGRFSFPGSPVGRFSLSARDRPVSQGGFGTTGSAGGTLNRELLVASVNVPLTPLGTLPVNVVRSDGVTPAENVTVRLGGAEQDTDVNGAVQYSNLRLDNYTVTAISRTGGELRNGTRVVLAVDQAGINPAATIQLPGIGSVSGTVVDSGGVNPVENAQVLISYQAPAFSGVKDTFVTGADGRFDFTDVPVGDYRVSAASLSLAASVNGTIDHDGEKDELTLRLGDSGSISGRLVRADGSTAVPAIDVLITFDSQSANPGRAFVRSDDQGSFLFSDIPVGDFDLAAAAPDFGGLIKLSDAIASNGELLDLGDLPFDEDFPEVVTVAPPATAVDVPTTTPVDLLFSEALDADSISSDGIFVRSVAAGERVPATLELLESESVPKRVRLTPDAPLISEKIYEVVVVAGDLRNAGGGIIGSGPRDLVDRPLTVPFVSRFQTADNDPPDLLSIFPSNTAVQIDVRAVPRLSFNEALQPNGFAFDVDGPSGPVPGNAAIGVNGQVLSFVPTAELRANASYRVTVSNVFDLAGNRAAGEPFIATFDTLDTLGPSISEIQVKDGGQPLAGELVDIEAVLADPETNAQVRMSADLDVFGQSDPGVLHLPYLLPETGSVTIRAVAIDEYGNEGQLAEQVFTVVGNDPPTVELVRVSPVSGPVPSGSPVTVDVRGLDDGAVAEVRGAIGGAVELPLQIATGDTVRLSVVVPADTGPGEVINVSGLAVDAVGQASGTAELNIPVSDGVAPGVEVPAPADGLQVTAGQTVDVVAVVSDAFGVSRVVVESSGAVISSTDLVLDPVETSGTNRVPLVIPADVRPDGAGIQLSVRAEDAAGNSGPPVLRTLSIFDADAPSVELANLQAGTLYNPGDAVAFTVSAIDDVGVTEISYFTEGAAVTSGSSGPLTPQTNRQEALSFAVPGDAVEGRLLLYAVAVDGLGQTVTSTPVGVEVTFRDLNPPETVLTSVSDPAGGATTLVSYTVTDGLQDLDYVAIYFRRNGVGTFNQYVDPASTHPLGRFFPQTGADGTVLFDSTRMGGDGEFEFYSVGVDLEGNREAAPAAAEARTGFSAGSVFQTIVFDRLIDAGNTTFDNQNVRIDGAEVTLAGEHVFHNLEVVNGGAITHQETTLDREEGLDIEAWTITVDSNSTINVDARGYLGGRSAENSSWNQGRTVSNQLGSSVYCGGSYGGLGGRSGGGAPNPVYGDLVSPTALGSGGGDGNSNRAGGDGGGRIHIEALHLVADGAITANGGDGNTAYVSGSGSGGSVLLQVGTLSGGGVLEASGGDAAVGGGGGRIAVHHVDLSTKDRALIRALGGQGAADSGGNGTVFLQGIDEGGGTLVVDGQGAVTDFSGLPVASGLRFDSIIIRNGARVEVSDPIVVSNELQVLNNSIVRHPVGLEAGLQIRAARVIVDASSAIDVTGRGYRGGRNGNNRNPGETLNGQTGSRTYAGGSYGGLGGEFNPGDSILTYGTPANPVYLGSGGSDGNSNRAGGNGGGRIDIVASDLVRVDGALRANGQAGNIAYRSGSGSGGSIRIETSRIEGAGVIEANGGGAALGGGGGRVAVLFDELGLGDFGDLRTLTAFGGLGSAAHGSAGTVYLRQTGQTHGDLYIDAGRTNQTAALWTPLTTIGFGRITALSSDTLTLDGGFPVLPGALVGMVIQPNELDPATFVVVSNSATMLQVDVSGGMDLTDVAAVGDRYAARHQFDNLAFRRGGYLVLGDRLEVTDTLAVAEHGLLTHHDTTRSFEPGLDLIVGTLSIAGDSAIRADGRGYLGGRQDLNGSWDEGRTVGNALGASVHAGASHGGRGSEQGTPNPVYGDPTQPLFLGSGGGSGNSNRAGGDGGGRIRIQAGTVSVDGEISADGDPGIPSFRSGSGSGGSILIEASDLGGSGTVRANGGAAVHGGGGGRVAAVCDTFSMDRSQFAAAGGPGSGQAGGHGTLFFKSSGQPNGDLVVNGGGLFAPKDSTPWTPGFTYDNVFFEAGADVVSESPIVAVDDVRIESGSTLRHPVGLESGIRIESRRVIVDATSAIDVTGRGYRGGRNGNNRNSGETINGQTGSRTFAGGSYGGLGGEFNPGDSILTYGIPANPVYLGSGGSDGNSNRAGGNGGGRIDIVASEVVRVDGALRSNGQDGSVPFRSGSGAGGSIRIETRRFEGSGRIEANGGGAALGGGGGRIAVRYDELGLAAFSDLRTVTAFGGLGTAADGSAGTVFLRHTTQAHGDLYLDAGLTNRTSSLWSSLSTVGFGTIAGLTEDTLTLDGGFRMLPGALAGVTLQPNENDPTTFRIIDNTSTTLMVELSDGATLIDVASVGDRYAGRYHYDNVMFRRGGFLVLGDRLIVDGMLRLHETSEMTHYDATLQFEPGLELTAAHMTISSNSVIDVDARGYLGGRNGENGSVNQGRTLFNARGSTTYSGGSYGGLGGRFGSGVPNAPYGDPALPIELGSGGSDGNSNRAGGDGGGRVQIRSNTLTLHGRISANGADGNRDFLSGSGSGGAVLLEVSQLDGSGLVQAHGGGAQEGGGGGRIAIHAESFTMDPSRFQAFGGEGAAQNGGSGTVFIKTAGQANGDLIIDGGNVARPSDGTVLPDGFVYDDLTLHRLAHVVADGPIDSTGSIRLLDGSRLTHPAALEDGLVIRADSLEIDASSRIDVSGRGYLGGRQPGNSANTSGLTVGGADGSTAFSGGSYGGLGGDGSGTPNPVYGDANNPMDLGSGGSDGSGTVAGGSGGGRVDIAVTGALTLNGSIRADGGPGEGSNAGGGSGGAVKIEADLLGGGGVITADGGDATHTGGGGRIAVYYGALNYDTNRATAATGVGSVVGQDGTVVFVMGGAPAPRTAAVSPRIVSLKRDGFGQLVIQWVDPDSDGPWLLETCPAFDGTGWTNFAPLLETPGWTSSVPPDSSTRFYRIQRETEGD